MRFRLHPRECGRQRAGERESERASERSRETQHLRNTSHRRSKNKKIKPVLNGTTYKKCTILPKLTHFLFRSGLLSRLFYNYNSIPSYMCTHIRHLRDNRARIYFVCVCACYVPHKCTQTRTHNQHKPCVQMCQVHLHSYTLIRSTAAYMDFRGPDKCPPLPPTLTTRPAGLQEHYCCALRQTSARDAHPGSSSSACVDARTGI